MTSAWELLRSERQGQVGRRALVAKTFRMPDGSEQTFTETNSRVNRLAGALRAAGVAKGSRVAIVATDSGGCEIDKRRAARLQANYDDLENRIVELAAKEDLQRVRPDLDGNEIMRILDIPAGPQVGQAWKYLKELRLDRGPLEHDEAVAELRKWWNDRG